MSRTPDQVQAETVGKYTDFINPYLAKLMNFAGFGVEVKGDGCVITDHEGREYGDFLGGYGVFSLGHRHPAVVQAVKDQLDQIPLSGKTFFNENQADLANALVELVNPSNDPEKLHFAFFSNSGAEAVEAALKFARAATGRQQIFSTLGSYHGKTMGGLSVTGREKYRKPFGEMVPGTTFFDFGDADSMRSAISDQVAAIIIEPIQGEGGIIVPPDGYLKSLEDIAHSVGALLIVDEVQTGLGRTGSMFAFEREGVSPDILILAKALGGGVMPIGATLFTPRIGEAVFSQNPLAHTSTFGGNPLACAAGLAAVRTIKELNLPEQARRRGERLQNGLRDVTKDSDLVKEVRGRGLMVGVEFTIDEVGELVIAQMVKRGIVAAYTLNNPRVIRFEPPLIVSEELVDRACQVFGEAIKETSEILAEFAL